MWLHLVWPQAAPEPDLALRALPVRDRVRPPAWDRPGGNPLSSKVFAPLSVSLRSDWASQLSLFPCSKYCCRSFFS